MDIKLISPQRKEVKENSDKTLYPIPIPKFEVVESYTPCRDKKKKCTSVLTDSPFDLHSYTPMDDCEIKEMTSRFSTQPSPSHYESDKIWNKNENKQS